MNCCRPVQKLICYIHVFLYEFFKLYLPYKFKLHADLSYKQVSAAKQNSKKYSSYCCKYYYHVDFTMEYLFYLHAIPRNISYIGVCISWMAFVGHNSTEGHKFLVNVWDCVTLKCQIKIKYSIFFNQILFNLCLLIGY